MPCSRRYNEHGWSYILNRCKYHKLKIEQWDPGNQLSSNAVGTDEMKFLVMVVTKLHRLSNQLAFAGKVGHNMYVTQEQQQ